MRRVLVPVMAHTRPHRARGRRHPRDHLLGDVEPVRGWEEGSTHVSFMVLPDGRIWFDGSAAELRESTDAYLRHFLIKTLPPW
jgi:hypothetical protein